MEILHQLLVEFPLTNHPPTTMPLTSTRVFKTASTATITRPKGHRPANEIGQATTTPYPSAQQVRGGGDKSFDDL